MASVLPPTHDQQQLVPTAHYNNCRATMFSERASLLNKEPNNTKKYIYKALQIGAGVAFGVGIVLVVQLAVSNGSNNSFVESNLLQAAPAVGVTLESNRTGPVVEISNGQLRGVTEKTRLGRGFSAFYGIPYAEPPVGKLRFQAPRPFKKQWRGMRDATIRGTSVDECIQIKGMEVSGKEDCLKLSVFTPRLPEDGGKDLPVMFYILGGAYIFGRSNRYGADYMMDEDVVLVLIDFRYGAFGHLNTEDEEIRGNMAFKDQVMALKWVQENISKFGGDPKRVLIFGNSSGAASVHAHLLSNMSNGLFHRAVSQSGSVLMDPGYRTRPSTTARNLGRLLGCPDVKNTEKLHKCLIQADPKQIVSRYILLPDTHVMTKEVIPKDGDRSEVFFEDMPAKLLEQGKFKKDVPWLVGSNSAEAYFTADGILKNKFVVNATDSFWDYWSPFLFHFKDDRDHNASHSLREFYFHGEQISNSTRTAFSNCLSDIIWVHPVAKAATLHAQLGGEAYYYWLTHEPLQSYGDKTKQYFPPPYGVAHADEVQLLYPFNPFPYIDPQSPDFTFSSDLIKIWTNFARTGRPTVPNNVTWPRLNPDPSQSYWMELNEHNYRLVDTLKERMAFLDSFPLEVPNYEDRYGHSFQFSFPLY